MPRTDEARAGAEVAIARRAFRQIVARRDVCALVFGGTVAASALSYVATFPDRGQPRPARGHDERRHRPGRPARTGLRPSTPSVATRSTSASCSSRRSARSGRCSPPPGCCGARRTPAAGQLPARRHTASPAGHRRHARALGAAVGVIFAGTTADHPAPGRSPDVGFGVGDTRALRAQPRDRAGGVRRGRRVSPRSSAARRRLATRARLGRVRRWPSCCA